MKRLWDLAWPIMILGLARVAMRTVDIVVVGFLGSWAAAAVGLGDVWLRLVLFLGLGVGAGVVARVSQGLGAGNRKQADHALTQATLITISVGILASVIFWFYGNELIWLLGAEPKLIREGGWYLKLVGLTASARIFYLMTIRAMSGAEDTKSPMWIGFLTTMVNIFFTVILVFGYFGLPELGVIGAAVGTMIGNILAAVICFVFLLNPRYPLGLQVDGLCDFSEGLEVIRVSLPRIVNGGAEAVSRVPFSSILLWFGSETLAAFEIAWRVLMLAMMPNWGISAAAGTYTGQHLGTGEPELAREQGWLAVQLALIVCLPIAFILVVSRYSIAYLFIREQPTLNLAAQFILVYGISMIFYAIALNLAGSLEGAGHTFVPMMATITGLTAMVGGPAVFSGYFGYGIESIYFFIFLSFLLRAVIVGVWFEFYRWKSHPTLN